MSYLKYIILLIVLSVITPINAQISFNNIQNSQIEISFRKEKIETKSHSFIFNILDIVNNSNTNFSGNIAFSVPRNWKVMGEQNFSVNIAPKETLSLPVRVSLPKDALGEIGYSVTANLTDKNNKNIKSVYFYVVIPRLTLLLAKPEKYMYFMSQYQNSIKLPYIINNQGNISELVHLEITTDDNLSIENEKNKIFVHELSLNAHSDTVIDFRVYNKMLERNTDYSKLQIRSYNNDTTYLQTVWIKVLNDTYTYLIPENEKVAIIELNAYNLFSDAEPNYSFMAKGNILFDKNRRFYYYSYNNFRDYSYSGLDMGLLNYSYIGYKTNYSDTRIGSVQGNYQQSIYGTGLDASFDYNKNKLKATYLKGIYYKNTSYGASVSINLGKINLNTGAVITNNPTYNIDTRLAFAGTSFNFLKYNSFSFIFGLSELQGNVSDIRQGYGLDISYFLRYKKLYINAKAKYGSQYYTGIYGGRTDVRAYLDYYFSKKTTLKLSYERYEDSYFNFLQYNVNNRYNLLDRTQISYNRTVNKNIFYQIGLSSRFESTKGLYSSNPDSLFNITMPGIFSLANVHIDKLTFESRLEIFRLYELKNSEALSYNQGVNALNISFNIQTKNVGLYSLFKYGPSSIYEHFIYLQDKI